VNIQEYISSGILELYVLDQLTPVQRNEVEDLCVQYPEISAEIGKIESTIEQLAFSQSKAPRLGLRDEILKKISEASPLASKQKSRASEILKYVLIFSLALLVGLAYAYTQLEKQKRELEGASIVCNNKTKQLERELSILKSADYKRIHLNATDTSNHRTDAFVYYNSKTQEVYLDMASLPKPPTDKQYQLWAIVGGKPVDAGVFETVGDLQHQKNIGSPQAFAVTVEKIGGVSSPTLSAMVVVGKI
jgi:hypothetical protein